MPEIAVIPARPAHIRQIATSIAAVDESECLAFGHTPRIALRLGLVGSTQAWTATVNGSPVAMFGVSPVSIVNSEGRPWLLGTDEARRHARRLLADGRVVIAEMHQQYARLSNYVSERNASAIRLLRKWDFSIGPDAIVVRGLFFLPFWRDRDV